jgi:HKD family nuclease
MTSDSLNAKINLLEVIESFSPSEDIQNALLLTFNFDGLYLEDPERGLLESIWQRNCTNILVIRDSKAVIKHKQSQRYNVINASFSKRIFHSKLILLTSKSEVMALIGSANLTQNGLEKNLELVCDYHLTRKEGPVRIFEAIHAYLKNHVNKEIAMASAFSHKVFDDIVGDLGRFLDEAKLAHNDIDGLISFLHNYDEPLYNQILRTLPNKDLDALWIVSPFFDAEMSEKIDKREDALEYELINKIFESFSKKSQSQVRFYFQASAGNATCLPVELLKGYRSLIELYKKDPTALDQRALHAKMLIFFGHRSSGDSFITIVHGSANFTRAALLSKPPEGNAEIVMLTQISNTRVDPDKLEYYLDLNRLFCQVPDWNSLSGQQPHKIIASVVQVWEGLASIRDKITTIRIYFTVNSVDVKNVRIMLCNDQDEMTLGEAQYKPYELNSPEFKRSTETLMQVVNQTANISQLLYSTVRVDAFDSNGKLLGSGFGALNVDRPEEFYGTNLYSEDRLDSLIYTYGVRALSYSDVVRKINDICSRDNANPTPGPKHHADLDLFFRRIHIGLRGLKRKVELSKGSLIELRSVQRKLASWGTRAANGEDETLSREERLYLCDRILRTAKEITEITINARKVDKIPKIILKEEFIDKAEVMINFAERLNQDKDVGMVATNLRNKWQSLEKFAKSDSQ